MHEWAVCGKKDLQNVSTDEVGCASKVGQVESVGGGGEGGDGVGGGQRSLVVEVPS